MQSRMSKLLLHTLSLLLIATSATAASDKGVTIVSFSDFHGQFERDQNDKYGGSAILAGYIKKIREISGSNSVVVIDAGDMFQGGLLTNQYEGKPVITFFNQLGLDASALGNHEFDYNVIGRNIFGVSRENAQEALRERIQEANFAILSSNLIATDSKNIADVLPGLKSSILIKKNGIKIGIVGALTKETAFTTNPINLQGLDVVDPVTSVLAEAKKLKQHGADVLILTIHEGNKCKNNGLIEDLSDCTTKKLFDITNQLKGTFDLIIGGHEGSSYVKKIGKTYVTQASEKAKTISLHQFSKKEGIKPVGIVYLCENFNTTPGDDCSVNSNQPWVQFSKNQLSVNPDNSFFTTDETIEQLSSIEEMLNEPLNVTSPMEFKREKYKETAIPNLFADVLKSEIEGADLGMMNGGGIRTALPAGDLLYKHAYNIFPFENYISSIDLKGSTLRDVIKASLNFQKDGYHWSGLYLEADATCTPTKILINGQELNDEKIYKIAMGDFLANGGGVLSKFIPEIRNKYISGKLMLDETVKRLKSDGAEFLHLKYFDPSNPRKNLTVPCPIPEH